MQRQATDWAGNIAALLIVISVNALANILPIAGKMTGDISAKYTSLFTPAGFTFGIWSVIYVALIVFVIYQALPAQRQSRTLADVGSYFRIGCAANTVWIFAWHYEWLVPSLLLMLVLLVTLIFIYRDLGIVNPGASRGERWLVQLPFGLYLGWIAVATIANVSVVQSALGWNDLWFDETTWTQAKLAVAAAVAGFVIFTRRDIVFTLVVAWAAFGISVGQAGAPAVSGAATAVSMFCVATVVFESWRRLRSD